MQKDFILPDIGEGIVECEVVEWKVKEGDVIVEDQVVADVSTDKAIVEIPSMFNGTITKLYYAEGDIAQVHSPLFAIQVEGEVSEGDTAGGSATETLSGATEKLAAAKTVATNSSKSNEEPGVDLSGKQAEQTERAEQSLSQNAIADAGKVLTTPAVRRLGRENNLDLSLVPGSGKQGRVLKEDVLDYLAGGGLAQESSAAAAGMSAAASLSADASYSAGAAHSSASEGVQAADRVEAIKGVRKLMAEKMAESVATIPHFTYVDEVDITELIELRLRLKARYADEGIKITMMPLFIKALSMAIKAFPILNSRANPEFTELTYLNDHNIGMAVDGKTGLLVPNVKAVQTRSILSVAKEVSRLTDAARSGKISPQDIKAGTISISNVGAIGGIAATPIINKPEVAIVALGRVQSLPRFNAAGEVEARQIMTISWSGDHRVIDGGTIARFSNRWKEYLEDPSAMLVDMV